MAKNKKTTEDIIKEDVVIENVETSAIPTENAPVIDNVVGVTEEEAKEEAVLYTDEEVTDTPVKTEEETENTPVIDNIVDAVKEDTKEEVKPIVTGRRVIKGWNGVFY